MGNSDFVKFVDANGIQDHERWRLPGKSSESFSCRAMKQARRDGWNGRHGKKRRIWLMKKHFLSFCHACGKQLHKWRECATGLVFCDDTCHESDDAHGMMCHVVSPFP